MENDLDMGNPRWEATKAFVSRHSLTLAAVAGGLVLLAAVGWAYQDYRQGRLVSASDHYQRGLAALQQGNPDRAREKLSTTAERFGGTPYGGMARVLLSRLHQEAGEPVKARKALEPLVAGEGGPAVARQMAAEELARLRWAAEGPEEALAVLEGHADEAFLPTFFLLRGDLLAETGRSGEARTAYERVRSMGGGQRLSSAVERRLDGLPEGDDQ